MELAPKRGCGEVDRGDFRGIPDPRNEELELSTRGLPTLAVTFVTIVMRKDCAPAAAVGSMKSGWRNTG